MGRCDKRLLVGALGTISAIFAGVLLLPDSSLAVWSHDLARYCWPWLRHALSRKNSAALIQTPGAFIAFYGLWLAYTRARYDLTPAGWILNCAETVLVMLHVRRPDVKVHTGTAGATFRFSISAVGLVQHNVDITLPLQEQIKRLATYANNRAKHAAELEKKISELQQDLAEAHNATGELERKLLGHVQTQIQELDDKIDRTQAVDLRWAIGGLLISGIGTLWGLGT